ncbi:MAG TPA: Ig-like domain-containing protein [Gemmatimonadales bacterium]|nr:Ig-like domain-containing protein [Gemmatimonadales bacterium]
MKRWQLALALIAITGCTEQRVTPPAVGHPLALILDGAHNGDPNFFFLPPLVPNPVNDPHFNASAFDATLSPTVEVCRLTGDPRSGPVFCVANAALVFGPVNAVLDATNQQYQVNWDTKAPPGLDPTKFYRIRVRGAAGKSVLGSIDVDPVDKGIKNIRTGDVVQFQDGRTLPIKFRIQQGEACTLSVDCVTQIVGAGGATIVTSEAGGGVIGGGVSIPAGALDVGEEITVTISKLDQQPCLPGFDLPQFEDCYRFTANPPLSARKNNPGRFNVDVIAAMCVELPVTITEAQGRLLQLHAFDGEQGIRALPNASAAFLPCEPSRFPPPLPGGLGVRPRWRGMLDRLVAFAAPPPAYASMVHLGVGGGTCCFSDITWALPAKMAAVNNGDGQTATAGTAVEIPPAVIVTDSNNVPVAGATVHFRSAATGSSVTPSFVVTGTDGIARVTSWVLGAGTNRLEAFALGIGPAPAFPIRSGFLSEGVVAFTATATVPLAIVGGTYNDRAGGPQFGTAFLFNPTDAAGTIGSVAIAGPPGWNGGAGLTIGRFQPSGMATTRSVSWVFAPAIATSGTYTASASIGDVVRRATFSIDASNTLEAPQITGVDPGTTQVAITWTASPSAQSFLVRVNPVPFTGVVTAEQVVSGSTRAFTFSNLSLVAGGSYQAVVWAFDKDVITPGEIGTQFNIGAHAVGFTAPGVPLQ